MKELHLVDTKADLNSLLGLATKCGMKELKTRWTVLHVEVCEKHLLSLFVLSLSLALSHTHMQIGGYHSFFIKEKIIQAHDPCSTKA